MKNQREVAATVRALLSDIVIDVFELNGRTGAWNERFKVRVNLPTERGNGTEHVPQAKQESVVLVE